MGKASAASRTGEALSEQAGFRWRALYVVAWSPVTAGYAIALSAGNAMPFAVALLIGAATVIPALLLGFWVIALCVQIPLRQRIVQAVLVHCGAAVSFSIAWAALIMGEIRFFQSRSTFEEFLDSGLAWQLVMGIVIYAVLAGVTYARLARKGEETQRIAAQHAETLRLQAELSALRARLDPHFLFNVLQTLGALIGTRPSDAQLAVEHLAALLARRLRGGERDDLTAFSEELTDVREYLALEQLRLGSRLRFIEHIDAATTDFQWPRFTLQPLVENAIRHGIALRASGGTVTITSAMQNGRWHVTVKDDGKGIQTSTHSSHASIGLRVIRERLRLHFGDGASLSLHSIPELETKAEVIVDLSLVSGDDE